MARRRCLVFSTWTLAALSFTSFLVLYIGPWQPGMAVKEIEQKDQQTTADMKVPLKNSRLLKHLGRREMFGNTAESRDDEDYDIEGDVEQELMEEANTSEDIGPQDEAESEEKGRKKRKRTETAEERRIRRLRRLADDQAEYRQWVNSRRQEKKRGGKARDGQKRRKGEKEKNVNFELWRDLLSLDEGDDWVEV